MDNNNSLSAQSEIAIPEAYRNKVYIRRRDCADASGLTVDHFDRLAWKKQGPRFVKMSSRGPALYPVREFFEWLHSLGAK